MHREFAKNNEKVLVLEEKVLVIQLRLGANNNVDILVKC